MMTRLNRGQLVQQMMSFVVLIMLCVIMTLLSDHFATWVNISNVLRQSSVVIIAASAATLIMISGGLDISVGGVLAISGVATALASSNGWPLLTAIVLGTAVGGLVGVVNGTLVVKLGVTPVIATLGTLSVARGGAFLISDGSAVVVGLPNNFKVPARSDIGGIPTPVIIMAVVVLIFHVLLTRTLLGRYTYAIGGNPETARLSGIPVSRIQIVLYTMGGLAAGLGGVLLASRLASGQPNVGLGFEFEVIVAVILGGTSLAGGQGSVYGTVIGALIVGVLGNGLNLLEVQSFYQLVLQGLILVAAVVVDMALKGEGPVAAIMYRYRSRTSYTRVAARGPSKGDGP